jgi:hypothetical protein
MILQALIILVTYGLISPVGQRSMLLELSSISNC